MALEEYNLLLEARRLSRRLYSWLYRLGCVSSPWIRRTDNTYICQRVVKNPLGWGGLGVGVGVVGGHRRTLMLFAEREEPEAIARNTLAVIKT